MAKNLPKYLKWIFFGFFYILIGLAIYLDLRNLNNDIRLVFIFFVIWVASPIIYYNYIDQWIEKLLDKIGNGAMSVFEKTE